jgi:signal transduction histidine kinase
LRLERQTARTEGIWVKADPDRLAQVFINLITNAAKYNNAEAPYVHISSIANRRRLVFDFLDNGPGIPPEERHLIFEKFSRGRRHGNSDDTGAGLGLAISHQIITRMHGKLELMASKTGGACFRVTMQRIEKPGSRTGKETASTTS